jgi:uncharacterized protein (TIRG00374 family)
VISTRGAIQAIVGIAISVVAIAIVLGSVDLQKTAAVLGRTAPGWLLVALAFLTVDVLLRAFRWQRLLAPVAHVAYRPILRYILVGYLANNVLPARLGELVRSHFLGDREGISRTTTLGTVVVERVIDTTMVVAIAAVAILVLNVRGVITSAVTIGAAVVAILLVGLIFGIAAHRLPGATAVARWAARWPRVGDVVSKLRSGLSVAGRPRTLVEAIAISAVAWLASLIAFTAAGQAVGLELRIGEAALLVSSVARARALPTGPGYLGTYELAAVKVAEAIGLPTDEAFAAALLVHASIIVFTSLGGLISLASLGWGRTARAADIGEAG